MSESERGSYNIGMWAKPEAFCVICIFQGVALFFVWEAVLCSWGASEECFIRFENEGHARVSERTGAWIMFSIGLLGVVLTVVYWRMVWRHWKEMFRRSRSGDGSDAADERVQRFRLLSSRRPARLSEVPENLRMRSPSGSPQQNRARGKLEVLVDCNDERSGRGREIMLEMQEYDSERRAEESDELHIPGSRQRDADRETGQMSLQVMDDQGYHV